MPTPLPLPVPPLSEALLARRDQLPRKPAAVELRGEQVELLPLDLTRDLDALYAVSCGAPCALGDRRFDAYDPEARIWRYMSAGPFADAAALGVWLTEQLDAGDGRPFVVRDRATARPVGVANLLANQPSHLKIELGSILYGPIAQGTGASREATFLLLAHVFALGYQRAEWKCDARNDASRRAARSYGFVFEGVQDAHYIIKGRRRDTAWYRMLVDDWVSFGNPTLSVSGDATGNRP